MKLYLNKTSPYARLVLVIAHETALFERLQLISVDPWNAPPELLAANPLARIPALVTDTGSCLIESDCIGQYLLALAGDETLLPVPVEKRLDALRRLGLARAVIDCAFSIVIRARFGDSDESVLSRRWQAALPRAVSVLEQDDALNAREGDPDLGDLAIAIAFDYCDLRVPELDWRATAPRLAQFVDRIGRRPSMIATLP
ncbi:glutathione S-transferase family protein [Janthinobacterium agaricidamnosum]|uniref:Glutathione S-transferase domain protein n=1 Tax=Janthinobacterium agaricidamnosum NBRC 102515 = DSM 9628 TaxID=1349767 RepID=W0VA35_9BURK|nr:glutathione S-transferase N-terminal domain-containing protein [Janthinobacterium agaricidamnosum]CDG85684.1 glutathione S-transferase domain protein [Janthinobacterium agaricidamnosum NBRC 102515 = DSM 9628]